MEELYKIMKHTTFSRGGDDRQSMSFSKKNYLDNRGILRQAADGLIKEMSEKKRKKQAILREAYKTSKIIKQRYREVESSESFNDEDSEDDAKSNNKPAEESWQDRRLRSRKRSYFLSEEKSAIHLEPLNQGKKKRVHEKKW